MLRDAIGNGSLPQGVTDGVITLFHKGGMRNSLNFWRPITLLNISYNLFAKALQMRLQPILMDVISPDQSAFLPLRFILDNIFMTHETIAHAKKTRQPLVFLKLDFSKAYDKVELDFLFRVMDRFGFPREFTHMTQMLFGGASVCVSVNGRLTRKFSIRQGVRQGCPLAPYIFLIIGEVLNLSVQAEAGAGRIRGISLPRSQEQQIMAQYADDSSLILRGEEYVVNNAVMTLDSFSTATGLQLNWDKSSAYWWKQEGEPRPLWTTQYRWQWGGETDVAKLLGTPFGLSISPGQVDQFLIDRIQRKIAQWSVARLNGAGRAVVVNGILISATMYFLSIWVGSQKGVKKVISLIRNYLFAGTSQPARTRVAWNVVCSKREEGGLNIVNPADAVTALMSKWVINACEPGSFNFKIMLRHRLSGGQPYHQGRWHRSMHWFSLPNQKATSGSRLWGRTTRAWSQLVKELIHYPATNYDKWLSSQF
jgi:hypothetical protein